jgi:hypothetical protein
MIKVNRMKNRVSMAKVNVPDHPGHDAAAAKSEPARGSREAEQLLDPDRLLERLDALHRSALSRQRYSRLELYHRASVGARVTARSPSEPVETQVGRDEGVAVRLQPPGERGLTFAAASGCDESTLRWALDQAVRGRATAQREEQGWPSSSASSLIDRDPSAPLPSPGELAEWMERARESVVDRRSRGGSVELLQSRVEVALTVESWAAESGLRASRRRVRCWAVLQIRPKGGTQSVLSVASRSWMGLSVESWRELLADRMAPRRRRRIGGKRRGTVVFNPEASGELVAALVRSVHLGAAAERLAVGPGWSLSDLPQEPEALFGGLFDDAGFYTAPTRLAANGILMGRITGEGHFRRPSYRDPPAPLPSHIVVDCVQRPLPDEGLLVSDLRIHTSSSGRWILEIRGSPLPEGLSGSSIVEGYIQVAPRELLWHCAACLAPHRLSHRGVRPGSLLFEDLPLQ